jgi:hypothetical protein
MRSSFSMLAFGSVATRSISASTGSACAGITCGSSTTLFIVSLRFGLVAGGDGGTAPAQFTTGGGPAAAEFMPNRSITSRSNRPRFSARVTWYRSTPKARAASVCEGHDQPQAATGWRQATCARSKLRSHADKAPATEAAGEGAAEAVGGQDTAALPGCTGWGCGVMLCIPRHWLGKGCRSA